MSTVVIDTNVLLVANQQHHDVSEKCILACIDKLERTQKEGIAVIDDDYRIISEYLNKTDSRGIGVGSAFLKWLLQNQANTNCVHQCSLNEMQPEHYHEFPDHALQSRFDAPDRKFPAVANAHNDKPPVLQAADCKWLNWWPALHDAGIFVDFVCPEDVCCFYANKFPNQPIPAIPGEA